MDHIEAEYLCHYGVKGMKWGVRKKSDRVSIADRRINRLDKKIAKNDKRISKLSSKKHGTARYATIRDLKYVNDYNKASKDYISKKQAYKSAKGTSKEASAKQAMRSSKLRKQAAYNKASGYAEGSALAGYLGYGKSARGSYIRSREMGRGRVNSALRATGKQTAINVGKTAAAVAGVATVGYLLNNRQTNWYGNGSSKSIGSLPASDIINAKHVKVRTIK